MSELKKIIDGIDVDLSEVIEDVDSVAPGVTKERIKNIRQRLESAEDKVVSVIIENLFRSMWEIRTGKLVLAAHKVIMPIYMSALVLVNAAANILICPLIIFHNLFSRESDKIEKEMKERAEEINELRKAIKETEKNL